MKKIPLWVWWLKIKFMSLTNKNIRLANAYSKEINKLLAQNTFNKQTLTEQEELARKMREIVFKVKLLFSEYPNKLFFEKIQKIKEGSMWPFEQKTTDTLTSVKRSLELFIEHISNFAAN
jgi:hypothetical protein